jgi:hypothetical protein
VDQGFPAFFRGSRYLNWAAARVNYDAKIAANHTQATAFTSAAHANVKTVEGLQMQLGGLPSRQRD